MCKRRKNIKIEWNVYVESCYLCPFVNHNMFDSVCLLETNNKQITLKEDEEFPNWCPLDKFGHVMVRKFTREEL